MNQQREKVGVLNKILGSVDAEELETLSEATSRSTGSGSSRGKHRAVDSLSEPYLVLRISQRNVHRLSDQFLILDLALLTSKWSTKRMRQGKVWYTSLCIKAVCYWNCKPTTTRLIKTLWRRHINGRLIVRLTQLKQKCRCHYMTRKLKDGYCKGRNMSYQKS